MPRGWKATGLLQPLWKRYDGKRDELARAVGTSPTVLSSINSGSRNLGIDLGRRLAAELGVSLLELGAPADLADDDQSQTLRARLEELEAAHEGLRGIVLDHLKIADELLQHARGQGEDASGESPPERERGNGT